MTTADEQQQTEHDEPVLLWEVEDEVDADEQAPSGVGFWQRIRRTIFPVRASAQEQIEALTNAIRAYPNAAVNYLLRGELYRQTRQHHLARADFEQALDLAVAELQRARWGLTAQSIADRARQHLAQLPAADD